MLITLGAMVGLLKLGDYVRRTSPQQGSCHIPDAIAGTFETRAQNPWETFRTPGKSHRVHRVARPRIS
jgi:hypothetical protein